MSINNATPRDWDQSNDRISKKTGLEAWEYEDIPVTNDPVSAPAHYNNGSIECIDAIEASMSPEGFKGYCKGNALKYIWRMSYKQKPVQDLRKARWYLDRLIAAEIATPTAV